MIGGWIKEEIDNLCNVEYGTRVVQKNDGGTIYPVYGGGGATFAMDTYNREDRLTIARFAMSPKCTRFIRGKFFLNDSGLTLSPKDKSQIEQEFLNYQCLAMNDVFYSLAKGSAQKNLDVPAFRKLKLNIPTDIKIQRKIVAKLNALFSEIDKATTASETNAENAKRYLGKLIDEIIHHGLEKYTELTLNEITEVITCGVAKRPEYVESGVPFLSARNVKNGKMKWDRYEFVSKETHNTLSKYNKPKIGDILYSRVGAGFGDAAIIDKDIEFSIFVSLTLLKVKPVVNNEFLCYYLNSPFIKEVARKNITGTGVGNLNVGAVRQFKIKLPTLEAQREIVKKLDSISQNGRILIDSYNKKLKELSLLKQSILIQAFNGELVKE